MSFIADAKVGTKLIVTSATGVLLVAAMLVNQVVSSRNVVSANEVVQREQIILDGILGGEMAFAKMQFAVSIMKANSTPDAILAATKELETENKKAWDGLEKPISIAMKPDVLKDIRNSLQEFEQTVTQSIAGAKSATKLTFPEQKLAEIAERAKAAISGSVTNADKFTRQAKEDLSKTIANADIVALTMGAIVVLILICSTLFLIASVGRPIRKITASINRLAEGDTSMVVEDVDRKDEIGNMAKGVELFRQAAIEKARLEKESDAARNLADEERRRNSQAERAKAEAMAAATAGLAGGLKHLASGNLSCHLDEPFAADFESLRADFNAAVGQLAETLTSVVESTRSIDSGSREISQSSDDLSKRTEQQAASLEETAAALDQITANVSNSSKRAEEARSVAVQANASAAQSGTVVANAVNAMQKIEQSSNQIASIIGVIDEIAFQTNLLALNAGVEAARAGEAGKGFAVVAQEVRELAQRSAKAAKEIKDLIRNSSVDVQSGVKLVSETGESLKTIESYIVTVNQHMDSIATSAREQSVGLAEVNTAVNQMDQVTQQNAAMVEETNAASATLAQESARLRELISQFQIGGHNAQSQVATLRHTASAMASPRSRPAAIQAVSRGNQAVKPQEWAEF